MRPRPLALAAALAATSPLAHAPRARADVPSAPGDVAAWPALADPDLVGGETIVVEAEAPPPAPPSARRIDGEAIAATPRRSAEELLRLVPGLHTSQHASEGKAPQIFLRGFDAVHGADLELRLAGIALNEPSNVHGQGYLDLGPVIAEAVAAIEVREGTFALDQGPFATAGTVDVTVGVPAGARGHRATVEGGTTRRLRVLALIAPVDRPDEEVVAVEAVTDAGYGAGRATARLAALAQTAVVLGRWRLAPVVSAFTARFGEPGVVPLADVARGAIALDGSYTPDLVSRSSRMLAGVTARWRRGRDEVRATAWGSGRRLALDENFTGDLLEPAHGDRRLQVHDAHGVGVTAAWDRALDARVTTHALGGVWLDRLSQREDWLTGDGVPWRWERALAATQRFAALGAGASLRVGQLRLTGGARVDALAIDADDRLDDTRDGARGDVAVSPRLRAAWRRGRLVVHAGAGRGVRPPEARAAGAASPGDTDERLYDGGEPRWTAADGAELGATWESARLAAGASAFAAWIDREQLFDHVSGVNLERDGSRRLGAELHAAARPVAWLEVRADLTLVDARFVVTHNPVPGVPPVYASVEARARRGAWHATVVARAMAARPLAHGATGRGQASADALVGWRRGAVEVGLSIDNVTDARWDDGEYHFASHWDPSQPRSALPRLHVAPGRPLGARLALTLHH